MGCTATKPLIDSPPQGLEKLKMENGYTKGRYSQMGSRRLSGPQIRPSKSSIGSGGSGSVDSGENVEEGKLITKDREGHGVSGRRSSREEKLIAKGKESYGANGRKSSQEEILLPKEKESYGGNGRTNQDGNLITKEKERKSGSSISGSSGSRGGSDGSSSRASMLSKQDELDELIDGWPKWLVDNVPKDALAGLVPKSAEAYDKLDKVGQGTYSNVYKARDRDTGKVVALKKVRFETSEPESVKFMAREIMILRKLDHPNIVKLEGLATSRMQYSIYLVFDYMQTDLSRIITRPEERLTEPQVKCYMQQLLSGLQHCHERGILHRDIKGSNLLIDKNGMLKIADFGLGNYYNPDKKQHLTSRVVTLWYRAPELLLGATDYGPGIDLWSAGCLMAEMFFGRPVMPGRTEVEQLHRIFKLCGTPSEEYWRKLKVSTTFRPPHSYKPNFREVFRDLPKSSVGLLNTLLALDPSYRGSAQAALHNEFFLTNPLACDLSGLPAIHVDNDDLDNAVEHRKHRKSRMRHRSRTVKEHRRKEGSEKPEDKEETKEQVVENQKPGTSTSPIRPNLNEETQVVSPDALPQRYMRTSDAHPNGAMNIKNTGTPPLPSVKKLTTKYEKDAMRKSTQVQRSSSTREFRKMDPRKFHKLDDLVD